MKKLILSIAIINLLQLNFAVAQQDIVNGDFEFWDTIPGTNGLEDPVGWTSNNFGIYNCTTGIYNSGISKSTDSYSGNYSLRVSSTNCPCRSRIGMVEGNCQFNICWGFYCDMYPVNYNHHKLVGYYKFIPNIVGNDSVNLYIHQTYYDSALASLINARSGLIWFTPISNWTYFEIPIGYNTFPHVQGENFTIAINLFNNLSNLQGYLLLDSLALVPEVISGLEINPSSKMLFKPNPVKEKLFLENNFEIKNYELYDLYGRIIKSGPFEKEMDVGFLSKGIYFLRLQGKEKTVVEKFVKE